MDLNFISERIAKLCTENKVSEREVSLSIGKSQSYINYITNGKMFPTMESFFDICDYFKITPYEFFDTAIEQPLLSKDIYKEIKRLTNNDLNTFFEIIKCIEPNEYRAFLNFLRKYKKENNS